VGAPSKRARKIRTAAEFDTGRLQRSLTPPKLAPGTYAWTLADIVNARDMQMLGNFRLPARLSESMRTDDALFVARENRLAPQRCIKVCLKPAKGARAVSIAGEGEALFGNEGVGITPDPLRNVHDCLVEHGIAFAINVWTPREDGSRVDIALQYWPIEWVRWDAIKRCYVTQTEEGPEEEIHHGDGRWVVFQEGEHEPFKQAAAVLPAALVWARHAYANRDWAKGSTAHGNAKVLGELPEGMPLQDADGNATSEAAALLELLQAIGTSDSPVGIKPAGSKVDFIVNSSTAWQVWSELITKAEKAAARIYLGTDGTLGSQGGAPGVDISVLFGVASTKVQGDLGCIKRGLQTGTIEPWCAINFGDSSLAPSREYKIPDPDEDAQRESYAKRSAAFYADLKAAKDVGAVLTQEFADTLAGKYGVCAPIIPAAAPAPAPSGGVPQ